MNRRAFIAGLVATVAGLMVPERRVWALDQTMVKDLEFYKNHPVDYFKDFNYFQQFEFQYTGHVYDLRRTRDLSDNWTERRGDLGEKRATPCLIDTNATTTTPLRPGRYPQTRD